LTSFAGSDAEHSRTRLKLLHDGSVGVTGDRNESPERSWAGSGAARLRAAPCVASGWAGVRWARVRATGSRSGIISWRAQVPVPGQLFEKALAFFEFVEQVGNGGSARVGPLRCWFFVQIVPARVTVGRLLDRGDVFLSLPRGDRRVTKSTDRSWPSYAIELTHGRRTRALEFKRE